MGWGGVLSPALQMGGEPLQREGCPGRQRRLPSPSSTRPAVQEKRKVVPAGYSLRSGLCRPPAGTPGLWQGSYVSAAGQRDSGTSTCHQIGSCPQGGGTQLTDALREAVAPLGSSGSTVMAGEGPGTCQDVALVADILHGGSHWEFWAGDHSAAVLRIPGVPAGCHCGWEVPVVTVAAGDIPWDRGMLVCNAHPARRKASHHSKSGPSGTSGGQCQSAGSQGSNGR